MNMYQGANYDQYGINQDNTYEEGDGAYPNLGGLNQDMSDDYDRDGQNTAGYD